jgi:thiol-disulfide isomerase/thioredoxin
MRSIILAVAVPLLAAGCGSSPAPIRTHRASAHGTLSELSRLEGKVTLCEHRVPEPVCTRHHSELIPKFKRVGDWCAPHGVPESQCHECHPDLTFEPLPKLGPEADIAWLSEGGEDVGPLDAHAVKGKVTVFDFYAEWCAACRKVDGHMFARLARGEQIAYRKLNLVDWDTPLAQRFVKDVPSLPFVVVYGADGKQVATLTGADLAALDKAIATATKR